MQAEDRKWFDEQLEIVLDELPDLVKRLIDEIPLVVEDYPSRKLCEDLGVEYRDELCGLYVGISLDKKSINHAGHLSDTVYLFREGIFASAADEEGYVTDDRLRAEIRLTILHEYGHHHGLDEDELRELGYG